jgi:large repetitive protein
MRRFVRIVSVVAVLAAIIVPTALALGFDPYNPNLPDATVGIPYSFQQTARGGCTPYTFTVLSGSIPPGIQLQTGGLFNGTATQPGTWGFYMDLKDNCGFHAQRPFSLTVIPKVTVTTASPLATGIVGVPYSLQLTASGAGAFTWSLISGTLPAGLTLSSAGLLSGTPTVAAPATNFVVSAKDSTSDRSDTKQLSLEVLAPLTATVGTAPAAEVGIDFKGITPTAAGGKSPYAWAATGLPAGLTVDPTSGAIAGNPTAAGSFTVHLSVVDATTTTVSVDVPIAVAAKLTITTLRLPVTKVGGLFQAIVKTRGGAEPIKWKVTAGRFPVGIRLDTKTGVLSGKPRTAGIFPLKVTVTDKLGGTFEQSLSLLVKPKPKPIKKKKK